MFTFRTAVKAEADYLGAPEGLSRLGGTAVGTWEGSDPGRPQWASRLHQSLTPWPTTCRGSTQALSRVKLNITIDMVDMGRKEDLRVDILSVLR
ncbi:MAG: hypothetical protein RIC29_02300 [Rhodospirillaceae bacterium]